MASRSLDDLCPEMKEKAIQFKELCKEAGIDALIYCTWRGKKEQDKAFAEKKSKLKFPNSKHNCVSVQGKPASKAFDAVAQCNGIAQWNDLHAYAKMGEIARSIGLEWGGDWVKFRDRPHFQLKG